MDKKHITENLICESFKSLLLKYPFEKITIKMITDEAGIIRPSFYNYFQDKYELLEWFVVNDILVSVDDLLSSSMEIESLKMVLVHFGKDKEFYKKAFEVKGQNSFEEILTQNIVNLIKKVLIDYKVSFDTGNKLINIDVISKYYANGFVYIIKIWLDAGEDMAVDDIMEAYLYLLSHSVVDFVK